MTSQNGTDTRRKRAAQTTPEKVETRRLSKLRWNARQDENFRPLSDDEMAVLVEDMRRNGQRTPIEITPDATIIDGHQRKRAAEMLGWHEVSVLVRYDLAGDEAAIERRMIEANLNRRQLDILDRVRLARRMLEIGGRRIPGGLSQVEEQDLRDRVGEALAMSGRNVQRYLNILSAPMEVQRAFSDGRISMKLAEKVARKDATDQAEIADAIRDGRDPAEVVAAYLPDPSAAEIDPDKTYERFLTAATQAVEDLDGHVAEVFGGMDLDREIQTLKQAGLLITSLIARHKILKKLRAESLRVFGEGNGRL